MGNYVFAYTGGKMAETPAEQEAAMAAWGAWFGVLGAAVVDGGAPFAMSKVVKGDGSVADGGPSGLSGYSIVTADSLAAAAELAKGCPILADGGSVEVYESIDMM
ncbi:MAG TPA: YciI family protein [Acidimicrobiia bacterium]|nr:YciI family protein [Acidimicrobiia bacterium]